MRKYIVLCMAIACTFFKPALAQIEKGKWVGSLSLNGSKSTIKTYDEQNQLDINDVTSTVDVGVIANKMVSKHFFVGLGLSYSNFFSKGITTFNTPVKNKSNVHCFGPIIKLGFYKQLLKNIYWGSSLETIVQRELIVFRQDYQTPNEIRDEQNGHRVLANIVPIQCSYILKKKLLITLHVASFNYSFRRLKGVTDYADYTQSSFSLNPFTNGILFSYIF